MSVLACLPILLIATRAAGEVLGVAPADQAKYAGDTFSCLQGGSGPLPASAVNDEYCDCSDGSDEPGTGACAGQELTLFYCANKGSVPRQLYASRVGDGICDCCDGSDEAVLEARTKKPASSSWLSFGSQASGCTNTCREDGRKHEEARTKRMEMLKQGIAKAEQSKIDAVVQRKQRRAEIEKLEQDLPALEEALKAATALADVEREAEKAAKAAEEAAKAALEAETCGKVPACMWRQTGGCTPDGELEAAHDKTCNITIPLGTSGFCDCDGDGVRGSTEPGYDCKTSPGACCVACTAPPGEGSASAAAPAEEGSAATAKEDEPEVSEYAKWMDGAEAKLSKEKEKPQVSEYAKWMDGAGAGEQASATDSSQGHPADAVDAAGAGAETKKASAVEQEKEAKEKVRDNKDKAQNLQDKLSALSDGYLGYAGLEGTTISKKFGEHEYKLAFFENAKQGYTSLGRWENFDGPKSGSFKHGTRCWDGPERELSVTFQCGAEAQIEDVQEPSKCVYSAVVSAPGACEASELERMNSEVPMFGPRDEL